MLDDDDDYDVDDVDGEEVKMSLCTSTMPKKVNKLENMKRNEMV